MKILKKLITSTLLIASITSYAQSSFNKWAVGVNGGLREYRGDLGNGFFNLNKNGGATGGVGLFKYLNPSFDAAFNFNVGSISYTSTSNDSLKVGSSNLSLKDRIFKGYMVDYNLGLKYKFNNGYILKEEAFVGPFIGVGIGGVNAFDMSSKFQTALSVAEKGLFALNIPLTAGLKFQLEDRIAMVTQITYNYLLTDKLDAIETSNYGSNDKYLQYNFGIIVNLGKDRDTDGDGIPDIMDKCNNTRPGARITGEGCDFDSDGDGVSDMDDACVSLSGLAAFKGCPDTDGDGIADPDDQCPTKAGLSQFVGCPDTDNDGVQDSEDKCPKVAGLTSFKGCPDTDGDGVQDSDDKCPKLAGIASNAGCPEIKKEIMQKAALAAKGIFFETGKDVIKKESYDDLDNLIKILQSESSVKAEIQGHTDNAGDAVKNKALSQKRADAVLKYLTDKGVDVARLTAIGYGSDVPVADNKSKEGKAKNRRVEFKLGY